MNVLTQQLATSLGPPLVHRDGVWVLDLVDLPIVHGLSVLSRDPRKSDVSETLHANLTADWTFTSGPIEGWSISYLGAYNSRDAQFLTNSISEPVSSVAVVPSSAMPLGLTMK